MKMQEMKHLCATALAAACAFFAPNILKGDTWTDSSGNVWTYSTNAVSATVSAVSFETTNLTIPSTLGGKSVTAFTAGTFQAKERAVRVTIPASVTEIPQGAFVNCQNLKEVTILGSGLTAIRRQAFGYCERLESFTMPNSVTTLEVGVFSGCTKLETVTLSDALTEIPGFVVRRVVAGSNVIDGRPGYDAYYSSPALSNTQGFGCFENCTSLKTINWGANIKAIGNIAFLNCSALETVTIPNSVTNIGKHAFVGCSSMHTLKLGEGVQYIDTMAFRALPALKKVEFGSSVSHIGLMAFHGCTSLERISLPESVNTIEYAAFGNCTKMKSAKIATNRNGALIGIGMGIFAGCSSLETVNIGDSISHFPGLGVRRVNNPWQIVIDGQSGYDAYIADATITGSDPYSTGGCGFFQGCTSLTNVVLGANLKNIGNLAFYNCSALEKIVLPNSVTNIGNNAFIGCSSLKEVKNGNNLKSIGMMAFRGLPNLKTVTFGAKLNGIGQQAFQDCVKLQNFTLPATIQTIGKRAFAGCASLTSLTIPTNSEELKTELGVGAFASCTGLQKVVLGDTVEELPDVEYEGRRIWAEFVSDWYSDWDDAGLWGAYVDGVFYNCESLREIDWGHGLKRIGNAAFVNCFGLREVTLPANVKEIGNHAFNCCSSLIKVTVKGNIESLGIRAFGECSGLHYVDFQGSSMTATPGDSPFAFTKDRLVVCAAKNSTGWTGEAGVSGLPADGTWCGARITYAPPPEGAGNPYDFYLVTPTSYYDESWPAPMMVTSERFDEDEDIPELETTFRQGFPIYLSYAYDEYWRGAAFTVTNRFTLSGTKTGTFDYVHMWGAHETADYGWKTNATPSLLQNLGPGNYTLTLQLNAGNRLKETDYSNNTTSITFKVVDVPKYTVSFNLNGASGTAPAARTVREGAAIGELPTVTWSGHTFLGWYVGDTQITAATPVTANMTCTARWQGFDIIFWKPLNKTWKDTMFVSSSSYASEMQTTFKEGDPIYFYYACYEADWQTVRTSFVNRFRLICDNNVVKSGYQDVSGIWSGTCEGIYGSKVTSLQGLPPGTYTLTCTLDADGNVVETNEGNNTKSITFTVVASGTSVWTVTFNANGGSVSPTSRTVAGGTAIGTLPTPARSGLRFEGWYTAANGGTQVTASTKVNGNMTIYARWSSGSAQPAPTPSKPAPTPSKPTPQTTWYTPIHEKDVVVVYKVPKAVVLRGALFDGDEVVGLVDLKLGKVNDKKKIGKIAGSVVGLDGRKYSIKAVKVEDIDGSSPQSVVLEVNGLGEMVLVIGGNKFAGSLGDYHVQTVGDDGDSGAAGIQVNVEATSLSMFSGKVLSSFIPKGEKASVAGGKWTFSKAAKVKWAKLKAGNTPLIKDEASGKGLVVDTSKGATNLSGIKLNYSAKKGTFKGKFKVYELQGSGAATKLKKYNVKVTGVVVGGRGFGVAKGARPAFTWPVTVK